MSNRCKIEKIKILACVCQSQCALCCVNDEFMAIAWVQLLRRYIISCGFTSTALIIFLSNFPPTVYIFLLYSRLFFFANHFDNSVLFAYFPFLFIHAHKMNTCLFFSVSFTVTVCSEHNQITIHI